jgi:hypothetical protein
MLDPEAPGINTPLRFHTNEEFPLHPLVLAVSVAEAPGQKEEAPLMDTPTDGGITTEAEAAAIIVSGTMANIAKAKIAFEMR